MKNLKRALSFALASVMLIGMMVVGSSAAVLSDIDDVEHTEAVNSMVTLGLINGRGGKYEPEADITRAEMAKLICVALNGGRDPKLDGECQFTDMANHWAAGYVQYCVNMGIVSGRSATIFDPQSPITAQEAAKMLLVAIGYNADNEKFKGEGWGGRVDVVANQKGLYDDVMLLTTAKLNRDDAAQIVWNAMDAQGVEYDWYPVTNNGQTEFRAVAKDKSGTKTILTEKFGLTYGYAYMTKAEWVEKDKEYKYTLANTAFGGAAPDDAYTSSTATVKSANDYTDMFGMKVKILYKPTSTTNKEVVYGMYVEDSEVLFDGLGDDLPSTIPTTGGKIELGGDEYEISKTNAQQLPIYAMNVSTTTGNLTSSSTVAAQHEMSLVDLDGDGKGDYLLVLPYDIKEVTFVGKETITAGTSYKFEDNTIEEGIEKGDFVKIIASANNAVKGAKIAKAEVISATVDGLRNDEVRLDGSWYTPVSPCTAADFENGETYDVVVNGSFVFNADQTSEGATIDDVLYVSANNASDALGGAKAKVWFMDGTSATVEISKVDGVKTATQDQIAGKIYTYKVKDGSYELKTIGDTSTTDFGSSTLSEANLAGFKAFVAASAGKLDGEVQNSSGVRQAYIDDSAIVVVNYDTGDKDEVKFYTGKQAKDWDAYTATGGNVYALTKTVNGLKTAMVIVVTTTGASAPQASGDETYGYVLTKPYRTGDDDVWTYDVWTKDGKITVTEDNSSATKAAKGKVIIFKANSDNEVDDVQLIEEIDATYSGIVAGGQIAITGTNGKVLEGLDGAGSHTYKLTDDTVYLYVDSDAKEGVEDGEIVLADEPEHGKKSLNAWIVASDDAVPEVQLLVIEVNNKIKGTDPVDEA